MTDPRDHARADAIPTITDTRLKRTSSGQVYDVRGVQNGDIVAHAARDADDDHLVLTPQALLDLLKRGEYYLPDSPSGFQAALRHLRDRKTELADDPTTDTDTDR